MKQILPALSRLRLLWVLGLWLLTAGIHADVIVYYSSTSGIRGLNLDTGTESLYTTSPYTSSINALAANTDNGLVYYGSGTTVYYWNPQEGSGSGAHHVMNDLSSGSPQVPAENLNSGGATYLNGIYYVAAEEAGGAVTDIFALQLSSNGEQILNGTPLNLLTACGCTGEELGGLGDITAIDEFGQTVIYGATTDIAGPSTSKAGRWRFNLSTNQFTLLSTGTGGQLSSNSFGDVYLTQGNNFHNFNKATGAVGGVIATVPVLPYDTSAGVTLDYGDAPKSYGVAQHMRPNTSYNPILGSIAPDNELFGQSNSSDALGDDQLSSDDEDAINTMPDMSDTDSSYSVTLGCTGSSPISGWLDINQNGVFDSSERNQNHPLTCLAGQVTLQWNGISALNAGQTYARFRTASNSSQVAAPTGHATDGEVEDYRVIVNGDTTVTPSSSCPAGHAALTYTATNLPMNIGTNSGWTQSLINVPDSVTITDVNILNSTTSGIASSSFIMYLGFDGSFAYLNSHSCPGNSTFSLGFDDEAGSNPSCPSTDGGLYQPLGTLNIFDNKDSQGDWTFWIFDYNRGVDSKLENWELELCHVPLENPAVGIAKNASINNIEVTFDLNIENLGDTVLSGITLTDNLDNVFGAGQYTVTSLPQVVSGASSLTLDPAFTGASGTDNILDATAVNTLAVGASSQLQFTVRVDSLSDQGNGYAAYDNQAQITATSPLASIVSDLSDDGTDIDPNGDNNASGANEDDPTVFTLTPDITIVGSVFEDHGNGSTALAHNGIIDTNEGSISGVIIELRDTADPSLVIDSTVTDAAGGYEFTLPFTSIGTTVSISAVQNTAYTAISENTANPNVQTGSLIDNQQLIDLSSWQTISDLNFGWIGLPTLQSDGDRTGSPGDSLLHPHIFTPVSSGSVFFSLSAQQTIPITSNWNATLYHDQNCNTQIDIGEPMLTTSTAVTAIRNSDICILSEVAIPANANSTYSYSYNLQASVSFSDDSGTGHGVSINVQNTDITRSNDPATPPASSCLAGQSSLTYNANALPINIGTSASWTTTSISVPDDVIVADVNILNIAASGVADSTILMYLGFDGTFAQLTSLNCPGVRNFSHGYDDEATASVSCPATDAQLYSPNWDLSTYDGRNAQGDWTLWIYDYAQSPDSQLDNWQLEVCHVPAANPSIGLAKSATVTDNNVIIDLAIENLGDVALTDIILKDNLDAVFGTGLFVLNNVPQIISGGAGLTINSAYDGTTAEDNLLDATTANTLAIGSGAVIRFTINVNTLSDQGLGYGAYQNQATISGQSPLGVVVQDLSDSGTAIDPDDDNNASGVDEDDPTPIVLTPAVQVTGKVFEDHGDGIANLAHDGQIDTGENGLATVTVEVRDQSDLTQVVASATTNGNGEFSLSLPFSAIGNTFELSTLATAGYLAISENTNNSVVLAGSVTDAVQSFVLPAVERLGDLNFGRVHLPTLQSNNDVTANAGGSVSHTHIFRSYSSGDVTFDFDAVQSNPVNSAWSSTLLEDLNCNAYVDAGEAALSPPIIRNVSKGTLTCFIIKVFIPANAPSAALYSYELQASKQFSDNSATGHGSSSLLRNTDITRAISAVESSGELKLTKRVENLTQGSGDQVLGQGQPGDRLRYSIRFENIGAAPISEVSITDVTPAFTLLDVAILCPASLPASLNNCTLTAPATSVNNSGFSGNIEWTLEGQLLPGASGSVEYFVVID